MKKIFISTILSMTLLFTSCSPSVKLSGNYPHEIECLGSELDGSVTLKTWGKGKNRIDALEQARKAAVNAIIFTGLRNGNTECDSRPLLNMPNIRDTNSDYFNSFFKDGGEYKKFVSNKDESLGKVERLEARDGEVAYGIVVRVLRSELKKQLILDKILNINSTK
jgi:hypothetical protein